MGYLGAQASFTGTQNNKRVSVVATAGQVNFLPNGGYSINAIDVYRNGVKLVGQRDFVALDGVTVTLVQAANENDILEFVVFENFALDDVINADGDNTIRGNLTVSGDLSVTGTLNASVSNTISAGIATEAIRAGMSTESTRAGIATQVDGYLGVGVTGTNLNVTGVITANSFSGDGSGLTGIAATDDVSTNGLVVLGISTLAGATFSGVTTHSANNVFNSTVTFNDSATFGDDDVLNFGASSDGRIFFENSANEFHVRVPGGSGKLTLGAGAPVQITNEDGNTNRAVFDADGVIITGIATADGFRAGDNEKVILGTGDDLEIYHDGTRSRIHDNATNATFFTTNALHIRNNADNETMAKFTADGAVELYHDNSKKLETASGGINVGTGITMDGNGIAVAGILTANGITVGQNAIGARTIQSGGSPSGGADGDIYYIY